jgi:hypothetical protein
MTFLDSLTKNLDITDCNAVTAAANKLARHMKGLPPLQTCTFCKQEHDGTTALCLSCDDQLSDARDDQTENEFETPDSM